MRPLPVENKKGKLCSTGQRGKAGGATGEIYEKEGDDQG
jgi:hypothetical protein